MSTEPFTGEVKILGFNWAPAGYMLCQGQSLSIANYQALFSLIGTTYGGDGVNTFSLPDLQGRIPVGQGHGAGLPSYTIGEASGSVNVTLITSNLPAHIHPATGITVNIPVATTGADTDSPATAFLCNTGVEKYSSVSTAGQNYGTTSVGGNTGIMGSGLPFSVANPYLVLNYSIAVEGIYPSRN